MSQANKKISIFVGTGGVGKTTLSALKALSQKESTMLITIDPSKRLKDLFAGDSAFNPLLKISLSDRTELFSQFLAENLEDKVLLEKFKDNSLFKGLLDNLSVSQEFTSLYELVKCYENENYKNIILDTPPLQNSNDFFEGAALLEALFSGRLVSFFIPDEKRNFASRLFNRGRELVLTALSRLTGSEFIRELSDFFEVSQKVRTPLIETLRKARRVILESSEIYMVTSYEELSLRRVPETLHDLRAKGLTVKMCIINNFYAAELDHLAEGELEYEKNLQDLLSQLEENFKETVFLKVNRLDQEPHNTDELQKWSKDVAL